MERHLDQLSRSLKDKKSSESGFRRPTFWKEVQLDLLIRLVPLWMERVAACPEKNDLGEGEMNERIEQLGYKLMLVGPQVDFYLKLFAKRILGKMKPSYHCGEIKIIGITCSPDIWWYLLALAKRYGAEIDFKVPKLGDIITIRAMSTLKALLSPQRVGRVVYEKKHFRRSKFMENGKQRVVSKFVGRSRLLCDPEYPVKIIYKNGNIRLTIFIQKFNNLNVPTNVSLVG